VRVLTYDGVPVPGLNELVRTAVRLHPTPGTPGTDDSHFGGPLLWPAGEPWPACPVTRPADPDASDDDWSDGHPLDQSLPLMAAVAQFYRDDFPELPFPDGTDVLQVLFCPAGHDAKHYSGPAVRLIWRDSAEVTEIADLPEVSGDCLPIPCTFEPCSLDELPLTCDFPAATRAALGLPDGPVDEPEGWPELGRFSKIGGWTSWYATDRSELDCGTCGAQLRQTIAFATEEQDGACGCAPTEPVGWTLGRGGTLNVFTCPGDVRHPFKVRID